MSAKNFFSRLAAILVSFCLVFAAQARDETNNPAPATGKITFVLVHGAWGGGWDWQHVDDLLTADGFKVYRASLTGQGERAHLASTNIDLNTHIQDVVNIILWEDLHNVVLVGHSYGGMVITGVADRLPDRLRHVVYVDALLPQNGESVTTLRPGGMPSKDGYIVPFWVAPNAGPRHDVPQSVKTFTQPILLTNQPVAGKLPTTYILTVDKGKTPEQDDFYSSYQRAKSAAFTALVMEGDHNVQRSRPKELVELLEQAAR